MRPRHIAKAPALIAYLIASSISLNGLLAQPQVTQPNKQSLGNAGLATSAVPAEMWNSTDRNVGQLQQPPAVADGAGFRPHSIGTPPPNLRSSANTTGSQQPGLAGYTRPAPVTQLQDNRNQSSTGSVVQANYDAPRASSRTPLPPKSKTEETSKPKVGGSTLQMFISLGSSLAIVIGLFLGVAVLYRKSITTTMGRGLPKTVVQVLGKTTVAPRQQMLLLRFGSKLVLVSMIQGEARTISEITDPLEVDQLAGLCEGQSAGSSTSSFREIFSQGAKS